VGARCARALPASRCGAGEPSSGGRRRLSTRDQ
jgi:hypothetical protein